VLLVLVAVGGVVLLASPRHRSFYSGVAPTPGARAAAATIGGASAPAAPTAATPPAAPRARGAPATPSPVRVPVPDRWGQVRVPVSDLVPTRLPATGVPVGWEVTEFTGGDASVELVRTEGRLAIRLRSERNSFAVHRDLVLDVRRYPMLSWWWRVSRLPAGSDVREAGRDDQAAQVYVVFPRWPAPRTSSDVLGYVWDTRAPVGTRLTPAKATNVRIVVVESGSGRLDQWLQQQRNVAEDYQAAFGRQPPRVGKIALMIDSNDTRSDAEALFGDLTFSRPSVPSHTEIPSTMLR
jgi:hypothetical protein